MQCIVCANTQIHKAYQLCLAEVPLKPHTPEDLPGMLSPSLAVFQILALTRVSHLRWQEHLSRFSQSLKSQGLYINGLSFLASASS